MSAPLRFVATVMGLWAAARVAALMPDLLTPPAGADPPAVIAAAGAPTPTFASFETGGGTSARPAAGRGSRPVPAGATVAASGAAARGTVGMFAGVTHAASPPADRAGARGWRVADRRTIHLFDTGTGPAPTDRVPPGAITLAAVARPDLSGSGITTPGSPLPLAPQAGGAAPPVGQAVPSRWSGGAYVFHRGNGDGTALASGGQLGGAQAGVRLAYALAPGPARFAAVARATTALYATRQSEAALGVDWHPLAGRPLRVSIERRIDVGGTGRDAWSAYAAGGFWRPLGSAGVVDGYAQAGVVGANRRDLFADGALRGGWRHTLGGQHALVLGGGIWAAAQPGVARLDAGPRAMLTVPAGRLAVTAAAEWRVRVAGDARPGSGPAFTLAADF